ncbi:hypothetical protein DFR58_1394 [Anaerobacterium chartisolvens]|uniref:DUF402 domain-containing protein n=1 Tax=Anaerobacterium chartisolvens TaxID=1297424 RepID=A0A369AIZ9_9FIRM|nr:DUF402 domain-containing protein [Anaerobacterium chartisolvens]RCX09065.1 hypothetical protein DFR58_1394 [Anaerobacterium chartisolvens]
MKKPCILRKRYIPDETVDISGDELLYRDEEMLITRWKAIRPRADISGGISYAFLKQGIKISKFFNNSGEFIYWYCDIIDIDYDSSCDKYVLIDLLLDVKLMPDGKVIVMDADELAEAIEGGLVTKEQACRALRNMNKIVNMMYEGSFPPAICRDERFS